MKKKTNIAALSIFAAVCGIAFATPAHADIISFDNLNGTPVDADSIATYGPIAGSFSTAGFESALTQVSLKLSGTPDSGSVIVRLLSDSSTSPGSVLNTIGTLDDSLLSSTLSNYTLALATPFDLAANTRYWIELTSNGSSANWAWSGDISGPGVAGEYLSNINGVFANSSEAPYQMQVQVLSSVPEPSGYAILGFGLLGVVAAIRRRYAV